MPGHSRLIQPCRVIEIMPMPAEYLRGIELFNRGLYFECHETLEPLWQAAQGEQRIFLHALIQTAVALHHQQRGNHRGAHSLWQRARQKLLALPPVMLCVAVADLRQQTELFLALTRNSSDNPAADYRPQIHFIDSP